MKFYIKGFYGYKNFGDEMLFFGLLNYLQKEYNPELFTVEVGDKQRMQFRITQNKSYMDDGILDKLEFIENAENSIFVRRFRQILALLGFSKYRKYFKVFGGGEVLDESRKFPHNGRNLLLLHRYAIRKKQFILLGGIGKDDKKSTKILYKYLLPRAQKIVCREELSVQRAERYSKNNVLLFQDFSKEILLNKNKVVANLGNNLHGDEEIVGLFSSLQLHKNRKSIVLINISPKYFNEQNLKKIKIYVNKYPKYKIIFFPADINFDKQYYPKLRQIIPNLEIYDWTKHTLTETIDLFKSCHAGVGSRLHFLYPLKIFKKELISISSSDKVEKMINMDPGV